MLIACEACHRQYDVGDLVQGDQVRCLCSKLLRVPEVRERRTLMQHCSNCGGKLAADKSSCEYCSAVVRLGDRGLGETCPGCFARMTVDAGFCSTCGLEIHVESILKAVSTESCPRCEGKLAICEVEGEGRFTECTSCGGLWLSEEVFEKLTEERDRASFRRLFPQGSATPVERAKETIRYLGCPVCGELMNRRNFARRSGVIIDWCRGHGFWFDPNELERIMAFIDDGGMAASRDASLERLREERDRERRRRIDAESTPSLRPLLRGSRRPNLFDVLTDLWADLL